MIRRMLVIVVAMVLAYSPLRAEPKPAVSRLSEVTVYRGQALVTRAVSLPAEAGDLELVVSDLPERVVGASLCASAEGIAGVSIRSVCFRTRAAADAPRKEIAELDEQIKGIGRQIYANSQMQALLAAKKVHLDKLESFAAATGNVEMSKGVLNVDMLEKVSALILKQRADLAPEQIKAHEEAAELAEKLAFLQRKRAELAGAGGKTIREAVLFLAKAAKGDAAIQLRYLVEGANWSPAYNLRMSADGKNVTAEYLAQVHQVSGEDWTGVKLTLSTATPAMNAESPLLAPYWISLVAGGGDGKFKNSGDFSKRNDEISKSQYGILQGYNTYTGATTVSAGTIAINNNWQLNSLMAERQSLELNAAGRVALIGDEAARTASEGLAVSYPLAGKRSITSRPDQQLVQIAVLTLAPKSYYVAAPLLSPYVWRQANMVNTSDVPLLAGPYSAYIGGEFVGRGNMPLVACGQEVTAGFGVDAELRCHRELKDKSDRVSWGSMIQTFRYELRLENFKKTPVFLRLLDRIPATKEDNIQIRLLQTGEALSKDALYNRDYKDKGLLRWDIDLAPGSTAIGVRRIEYSFEMKYAKDAHIGREAAANPAQMKEDLHREMMQAKH